ncbi:MAG: hypothetical protein ACKN9K_10580, partial [Dolichospermum sp.]
LKEWIGSNGVSKITDSEQIINWKTQLQKIQTDDLSKLWESTIILELSLKRENYTTAFIQFVQILERLLYIQSTAQNWTAKGWIVSNQDEPILVELMQGWCIYKKFK